jgi:hypothetical protein
MGWLSFESFNALETGARGALLMGRGGCVLQAKLAIITQSPSRFQWRKALWISALAAHP